MNTWMMFVRAGEECCQPPSPRLRRSRCGNVASLTTKALNAAAVTNANSQFAYAKATADKLETGNTSTMATFTKMFARAVADGARNVYEIHLGIQDSGRV